MIQLLPGDCREVLATLPANSVHCVVTSPPYYGLRDYGTAQWAGGDAGCQHLQGPLVSDKSTLRRDGREHLGPYDGEKAVTAGMPFRDTCGKCGATRVDRQIGLEATPDAYLAEMVGVFREVRRVLRPDGTVWCNLGDWYAGSPAGNFGTNRPEAGVFNTYRSNTAVNTAKHAKAKDLLLMPARLALALQADGWWLRSDIIWHKPNPMPESVTDRPTSAHEHVFLLAKSARYFYDADAVREDVTGGAHAGRSDGGILAARGGVDTGGACPSMPRGLVGARNCRNVWTIATAPYSEAHFATFPPVLAERCIRAGTSERGCCAACGAPWGRVVERKDYGGRWKAGTEPLVNDLGAGLRGSDFYREYQGPVTTGWAPSCACGADTVPCTVLDPFGGAGTTALVADRLQRDAILIELNPAYTEMAMARCRDDAPLFAEPSPPPAEPPEEVRQSELF